MSLRHRFSQDIDTKATSTLPEKHRGLQTHEEEREDDLSHSPVCGTSEVRSEQSRASAATTRGAPDDEEVVKLLAPSGEKVLRTRTKMEQSSSPSLLLRVLTALFYGSASFFIMVINKNVLTTSKFPSFQVLGLGQMAATIVLLYLARAFGFITFPAVSMDAIRKIWPLPVFYLGNMIFGLGSTKDLSLPMMTVLRRFSILMTMAGEFIVLGWKPRMSVQLSVYMMILGAIVAAANDLTFNLEGYVFVLLNDFCTAANGVFMKKKLDSKDLGKYGLMFYNSLLVFLPATLLALHTGELEKVRNFHGWGNVFFTLQFCLSCVFGFILMLAVLLCTQYNSALTTTIIGCLKNILITYMGMVIGGDYVFSWANFVGLNISVLGSLIYTKVTFTKTPKVTSSEANTAPPTVTVAVTKI